MKAKLIGFSLGVLITPIALFFAAASGGAGHGDYFIARILFPLPMLSTLLFHTITAAAIVVAAIQFPIYGWLFGCAVQKEKRFLAIGTIGFHALMLVLVFVFSDPLFS